MAGTVYTGQLSLAEERVSQHAESTVNFKKEIQDVVYRTWDNENNNIPRKKANKKNLT